MRRGSLDPDWAKAPGGVHQFHTTALTIVKTLCVLTIAASVLGLFARHSYYLELLTHFRPHYLLASLLGCIALACFRCWPLLVPTAAILLQNVVEIRPLYAESLTTTQAATLRVLHANVQTSNREYARLIELIEATGPDLVLLQEVDTDWADGLDALAGLYPYRHSALRTDNFGISAYSRVEGTQFRTLLFGDSGVPSIEARLGVDGSELTLVSSHPPPPVAPSAAARRNDQLGALGEHLAMLSGEKVLIGDLNITPWSPYFDELLQRAGLRDGRLGFGMERSWPVWLMPAAIPIDHCLIGDRVAVMSYTTSRSFGSDHLAVIVDLALLPAAH